MSVETTERLLGIEFEESAQKVIEKKDSGYLAEPPAEHIILFIPGIHSTADWVEEVASRVEEPFERFIPRKIDYGVATVIHLLFRIRLSQRRNIILRQLINNLIEASDKNISIICHSLGTDLLSDALMKLSFITDQRNIFHTIVFIGSICKSKKIKASLLMADRVVLIRGSNDKWPIIAGLVAPFHYDATGVYGVTDGTFVEQYLTTHDHGSVTEGKSLRNIIFDIVKRNVGSVYSGQYDCLIQVIYYKIARIASQLAFILLPAALFFVLLNSFDIINIAKSFIIIAPFLGIIVGLLIVTAMLVLL